MVSHVRPETRGRGSTVLTLLDPVHNRPLSSIRLKKHKNLDDHNVACLQPLTDEAFLTAHTGHDDTNIVTLEIFQVKESSLLRLRRQEIIFPAKTTYAYTLQFGSEILLVSRSGFRLTGVWLDSELNVTSPPFALFRWSRPTESPNFSGRDGGRPYIIFRPSPRGGYIFSATHDHPRAFRNGIVAGRVTRTAVELLDGAEVLEFEEHPKGIALTSLTEIVPIGGATIPWIHDVQEDDNGTFTFAFSAVEKTEETFRRGRDTQLSGIRYVVLKQTADGGLSELTIPAGSSLYERESDYVGGIALNPRDPAHIVFSSQMNPEKEAVKGPARWRLWETRWEEADLSYRLLSDDAEHDCIRPTFSATSPKAFQHSLSYMKGTYSSYRDFETEIYSISFRSGYSCFNFQTRHLDLPYEIPPEGKNWEVLRDEISKCLDKSSRYLEFGAGGTTLVAIDSAIDRITSVDSDPTLLGILEETWNAEERNGRKFQPVVDSTPFRGEWGFPKGDPSVTRANTALYSELVISGNPDIVLIDGRFRASIFLTLLTSASIGTTILWDDYVPRTYYHWVEKYLRPTKVSGRVAIFSLDNRVEVAKSDYIRAQFDSR